MRLCLWVVVHQEDPNDGKIRHEELLRAARSHRGLWVRPMLRSNHAPRGPKLSCKTVRTPIVTRRARDRDLKDLHSLVIGQTRISVFVRRTPWRQVISAY